MRKTKPPSVRQAEKAWREQYKKTVERNRRAALKKAAVSKASNATQAK
jgi:hypothetical protein